MLRRLVVIAASVVMMASLTGCSRGSAKSPTSTQTATGIPSATPSEPSEPLTYRVCAEGYGWVRPSLDDQRRHLVSLGGEFQRLASDGYLFEGAYVADAQGRDVWRYGLFWALVGEGRNEEYALARSGLWAASPDSSQCDRTAGLTLLIDHAVTNMQFQGDTVLFTAREVPGYFQYVQYELSAELHNIGYRLQGEDGSFIDACCS